jgi:elongator complex protein 5
MKMIEANRVIYRVIDAIRLVIGFHSDIKLISKTGLAMQDALNRLASTIIKLEPLKERTHFETQVALTGFVPQETFSYMTITSNALTKGGIAHIQWRKKSGKVLYESNGFIMNATTQFLDVVPATQLTGLDKEQESEPEAILVDKKTDPTANLSFNLSLTDEQRKTKESLVLPFMKAQQLEVSVDEEKKSGLIYYDPDAADDFDDEDPDEDLDI